MAQKLIFLVKKTVATAGTAVQVTTTSTPATTILIQADTANTGNVYVGDSTVASAKAITLAPGQSVTISSDQFTHRGMNDELDAADLWLDASANSQAAHVFYLGRR